MRNFIHHHWPTLIAAAFVSVVAILIRLPSCYESFWVDELHTAWAIWGDFGQVAQRAAVGNQTPLYFQAMWVWKALVGESEVALRLSSVLAIAAASVLLVIGVKQTTGRLSAGLVSGAVLAVDSNSLFFGTEFRPYAFVMLLAVVATWAAVCLIQGETKIRGGNLRLILVAALSLAALIHPTSIVTLGLLPAAALVVAWFDGGPKLKFQISDCASLILIAAVGFALAKSSLGHSWEIRDQWAAFGRATSLRQFGTIWPWWMFVVGPGVIALLSLRNRSVADVFQSKLPMLVAAIATLVFFAASYFDWVPLWHRRYFVAALPMFAWSIGACFALPMPKQVDLLTESVVFVAGAFLVGTLLWQQGTIRQWQRGQTQLVFRGEDWRGAVEWLESNRDPGERVTIDAGLIEGKFTRTIDRGQSGIIEVPSAVDREYLAFPVSGPYFVSGANHESLEFPYPRFQPYFDSLKVGTGWMIARLSKAKIDLWLPRRQSVQLDHRQFGNVHVVHYKMLSSQETQTQD